MHQSGPKELPHILIVDFAKETLALITEEDLWYTREDQLCSSGCSRLKSGIFRNFSRRPKIIFVCLKSVLFLFQKNIIFVHLPCLFPAHIFTPHFTPQSEHFEFKYVSNQFPSFAFTHAAQRWLVLNSRVETYPAYSLASFYSVPICH